MTKGRVEFHEIGMTLSKQWGYDSERSHNELLGDTVKDRPLMVLCAAVKILDEINDKLDDKLDILISVNHKLKMLYPEERRKRADDLREQELFDEKRKQQKIKDREKADKMRETLEIIVESQLRGVPDSKLKNRLSRGIKNTFDLASKHARIRLFSRCAAALEGSPHEWDVTTFTGLGPAFALEWLRSFNNVAPKDEVITNDG